MAYGAGSTPRVDMMGGHMGPPRRDLGHGRNFAPCPETLTHDPNRYAVKVPLAAYPECGCHRFGFGALHGRDGLQ